MQYKRIHSPMDMYIMYAFYMPFTNGYVYYVFILYAIHQWIWICLYCMSYVIYCKCICHDVYAHEAV